ncbi:MULTISPECIES: twin-arginine translocase TatA/TatE family subunit [unclassified Rhodococcus (in: high G+C Gram-positive bacteria)]|jgi:sec-independent protein translocase protein TatA|uniref:twin-arginine translocase TatA/TatE family subunit n=1 Tax=unclassified Rhodococcus (in: high G+C Gram-positive bacteria) TaxID=192944 RepID=UPI00211B177E|nr:MULTISPECIES: twin-arginine translocase TatA/TatE family subunit [unclassified Rhodococcus (in: high G+C Gram-positive bacteria)]
MLHNLTGWHALIVLAILLLVFGSTKLPSLAKGVGQSMRILKDEVREDKKAATRDETTATTEPTFADASVPVPYRHAS